MVPMSWRTSVYASSARRGSVARVGGRWWNRGAKVVVRLLNFSQTSLDKLLVIHHTKLLRTGFPGNCCDLYDCEPIGPENNTCTYNGAVYVEGAAWQTSEGDCKCHNGISLCSEETNLVEDIDRRHCLFNGKVYHHNETWQQDNCTRCTCADGVPNCIAHFCQDDVQKVECLPLANCNKICPNGFRINKRGCEICRCAKASSLEEILRGYNVTEKDLVRILNERLRAMTMTTTTMAVTTTTASTTSSTTTTSTPSTTVQITDTCANKGMFFKFL